MVWKRGLVAWLALNRPLVVAYYRLEGRGVIVLTLGIPLIWHGMCLDAV